MHAGEAWGRPGSGLPLVESENPLSQVPGGPNPPPPQGPASGSELQGTSSRLGGLSGPCVASRPAECGPVRNGPRAAASPHGGSFWRSGALLASLLLFGFPPGPGLPASEPHPPFCFPGPASSHPLNLDLLPAPVGPVGPRGVHGRHEPLHHPQRERPCARGRRAHSAGVGARGSEAALNWCLVSAVPGWGERAGP